MSVYRALHKKEVATQRDRLKDLCAILTKCDKLVEK